MTLERCFQVINVSSQPNKVISCLQSSEKFELKKFKLEYHKDLLILSLSLCVCVCADTNVDQNDVS